MAGFNFQTDAPAAEPWEFPVTIDGVTYATREPSVAELAAVQEAGGSIDLKPMAELLGSIFVGEPRPPMEAFTLNVATALFVALLTYLGERMSRTQRPPPPTAAAAAAVRLNGRHPRSGRPN